MNAVEIEIEVTKLAEAPFDAAAFPFAFLEAYGNKATTLKKLRSTTKGSTNKSDLAGGVLQRNNIHLLPCPAGQVDTSLQALRDSPATAKHKAKYILATDGEAVGAEYLPEGEILACTYETLPDHFGFFLTLAGISTTKAIRENPFDIRATSRLNKLYVEILKANPVWGKPERQEDLNHFMAQLIFCFFAEDTSIFEGDGLFTQTVQQMTEGDGSNTHEVLGALFRAMSLSAKQRTTAEVPRWADKFPYVNGGLFGERLDVPAFSKIARSYLLQVGNLDWKRVNPDIFGSMIQAVADPDERSELGMHYTSVPNILKVLNPLFLDELRAQLEAAGTNARKLLNLRKRMARIRVFDPACGSGNFLVIAYKHMREIEAKINELRGEAERKSEIHLTNFRGIELKHFSAEVARLALIIAEYQADEVYRGQELALKEFLPLGKENWIVQGNALRMDWMEVCPPGDEPVDRNPDELFDTNAEAPTVDFENEGGEVYVCGNPPYLGSKKKSSGQVIDMERSGLTKAKLLDYVSAFILKGVMMLKSGVSGIALVSTSSICQGEQTGILWPIVLKNARVFFAYRPFQWSNMAANNAGVWCTIIGLTSSKIERRPLLYSDRSITECNNISPYLICGPNIIIKARQHALSQISKMKMGSNPVDGKCLILERESARNLRSAFPKINKFIQRYGGTKELTNGTDRACVWIEDDQVDQAMNIIVLKSIIEECRDYRLTAGRDAKKSAARPHAFCYSTYEYNSFVQVGNTIGNGYTYVPIDIRGAGYVSSHASFTIYSPQGYEIGIIASTLHLLWAETVAGRLGNGIRYGNTIVYNTFPVPTLTTKNKEDLTRCAEDILLARERYWPATIADMYDPKRMDREFPEVRAAHERNDETLERIYIGRRFKNDTERLERLFAMYTEMTSGKAAA